MDNTILSRIITGTLPYKNIEPDSVVFIGDAIDGPTDIPIEGRSIHQVEKMFGAESELTNVYKEFRNLSEAKVYLIKANGSPARAYMTGNDLEEKIEFITINSKEASNNKTIKIIRRLNKLINKEVTSLSIQDDVGVEPRLIDISNKTLKEVESLINRLAYLGEIDIYAEAYTDESVDVLLDDITYIFGGGRDEGIYIFPKILSSLLPISIKQLGIFSENFLELDGPKGCHYQVLSMFSNDKVATNMPCIITVGTATWLPLDKLYENLIKFVQLPNGDMQDKYQACEFVNFIVARTEVNNTSSGYMSNGVATYCGLISNLSPGESTTNKVLSGIKASFIQFTDEQIKELSSLGYVVFLYEDNMIRDRRLVDEIKEVNQLTERYMVTIGHGTKVYKGVNLLHGTKGHYNFLYDEEYEDEDGKVKYEAKVNKIYKSKELGSLSNVILVQELSLKLYEALDPFIGTFGTEQEDIVVAVTPIFKGYTDIIRKTIFVVTEQAEGFSKSFNIEVHIIPYGEIETISFTVSIW